MNRGIAEYIHNGTAANQCDVFAEPVRTPSTFLPHRRAVVLLCCLVLPSLRLMHPTAGRAGSVLCCRPGFFVALALLAFDVRAFLVCPAVRTSIMNTGSGINAVSTEGEVKQYPSLPKMVKGILFDMDGTLTDSDTLHFEAYRETFLKVSKNRHPVDAQRHGEVGDTR